MQVFYDNYQTSFLMMTSNKFFDIYQTSFDDDYQTSKFFDDSYQTSL